MPSMSRVPIPAYWQRHLLYRTTRAYASELEWNRHLQQDAARAERQERDTLPPRVFPATDAQHDTLMYRVERSARLRGIDQAINTGTPRVERVVPEWRNADFVAREDARTDKAPRFDFRTPRGAVGTVRHVYRAGRYVGTIRRVSNGWVSDAAPGVVVKDRLELAQSLLALKRGAAMPTQVQPQAPQPIKPRGTAMPTERFDRHVTAYPNMPKFGVDS